MGSSERAGAGGNDDWRVRVATAAGVGVCMGGAMLLGPVVGVNGLWQGMLAIAVSIVAGVFRGRFVGGLMFRPRSGAPPDDPSHT